MRRESSGWIKIHRSLLDWEWWDDLNTFRVWMTILLSVNHEPKKWRGIVINEGEMLTSYAALSQKCNMSVRSVRTAINHLKSTGELTCTSTQRYTLIKVLKWGDFQGLGDAGDTLIDTLSDKRPTNDRQATDKRPTTNKNEKNDKKVRNIFRKPSVEEIRSYISEHGLNVDADYFYDYYESNGWTVGKSHMKSWQSTLNNWNRREKKKPSDHVVIDKPSYMGTGYDPEAFKW